VSLKILSAETGLHSPTTYRILSSLTQNNFVEKDTSGHYRLGRQLQQLGIHVQGSNDIRSVARPVLEALCGKLNESVHLTIREGDYVVYIEKAFPNRMMQIQQLIGSRAPLHVTAVGKMVLGFAGHQAIEEYSQRTNLPMYTRNTINSVERLKQECFQALRDGYALDNEEAELDVGCIGVLVYDDTNTAVAGLSLSAPITRRSNKWIKLVIEAGEALSRQLGHRISESSESNIDSQ
jgi:DNA-binding IclR family transcriptional regulator